MRNLRLLVWVYLWLLLFEGALRKWIIPGLQTPLLVIRDPLVVWIYYEAYRNRLSFSNAFFVPNLVLAVCTTILAVLFGQGNFAITLYGIHADFLQIPFIFLIPQILHRDDVIAMGRFILYVSIPMTMLMILQFRASPDSLVNKGAYMTHYGTVRPSGTFSFIPGLVAFYATVASFLFFGYLQARSYKNWLLVAVTFCVLLACACSGSRSCVISVGIVVVAAILCVVIRGKGGMGILILSLLLAVLLPLLSTLSVFQDATDQLTRRFADAAAAGEGSEGMVNRYTGSLLDPFTNLDQFPFFGNGLGLGTNAAAGMLFGQREFIGPENEWGRLFFECGPVFGLLLCLFRLALTLAIGKCAYDALRRDNILPLLIFAASGISILNGQWGVPTSLGFAIFGAGLTLAACEDEHEEDEYLEEDHDPGESESHHPTATDPVT
jgi:hypothetical protein